MVKSHLNPEIDYPEDRELDDSDLDFDAQMWSYEIIGVEVYVALGKKKVVDMIDTFSIYLIKNDVVDCKIGLFEVVDSDTYRDSDGDLDINQLSNPLLFSFVTKPLLEESLDVQSSVLPSPEKPGPDPSSPKKPDADRLSPKKPGADPSSPEDIPPTPEMETTPKIEGIFTITKPQTAPLKEQTKAIADEEREVIEDKSVDWIAKYFENSNLIIEDVAPDGNTLD